MPCEMCNPSEFVMPEVNNVIKHVTGVTCECFIVRPVHCTQFVTLTTMEALFLLTAASSSNYVIQHDRNV